MSEAQLAKGYQDATALVEFQRQVKALTERAAARILGVKKQIAGATITGIAGGLSAGIGAALAVESVLGAFLLEIGLGIGEGAAVGGGHAALDGKSGDEIKRDAFFGGLGGGLGAAGSFGLTRGVARLAGKFDAPANAPVDTGEYVPVQQGDTADGFTFRGDSRSPDEIFETGFQARGESPSLQLHAEYNTAPPSAYVATSYSPNVAREGFSGAGGGYVYTLRPTGGVDVNLSLGAKSPFPDELEVAVPFHIASPDIMGARRVGPDGLFTGPFIRNPGFRRK